MFSHSFSYLLCRRFCEIISLTTGEFMDYLATQPQFNSLSLLDLLKARDQFHPHLMHKANVVGTAIGRYLIRKDDPYPNPEKNRYSDKATTLIKKTKPPRTLENSEVREYSWPCVLVFVSRWESDSAFDNQTRSISDYVPKTIYLEDGRSVPICIVHAPLVETMPPPIDPEKLVFPEKYLSGGYPVSTEVQGEEHFASLGCLLSDGHNIYALTNRHVTGEPGEKLYTYLDGKKVPIGVSSDKQIDHLPFVQLYDTWPGKNVYVNMDIGLIKIDNFTDWQPTIYGLGEIGPLADLSIFNLTLNLIGCPVQASGAASGKMFGQIAALFYRYKSVGGFEYVSDFLIGNRKDEPLQTKPGDSGTIWAMESDNVQLALQPIAVQWGGTVFSEDTNQFPFALATNLSNVCRELKVDLFRSRRLATFDYWGAVGHYTVGSFACELVENQKLKNLMKANQRLISFATTEIDRTVNDVRVPGFVQLADVPDKVWKNRFNRSTAPYGRSGRENPNHYADIDYGDNSLPGHNIPVDSLDARTPTPADLTTANWRDYYDQLGWTTDSQRGCLPFRVWQIYKDMVQFVRNREIAKFVTAAGVIAHYIGDACQPLHGSYLDDGDPWRNPDGTPAGALLGHSRGYGAGIHHAYEASMIDQNVGRIIGSLNTLIGTTHGMQLVHSKQEAGFATIELIRRAARTITPMTIVEKYVEIKTTGRSRQTSRLLWDSFGNKTIEVMEDGCRTLAMIWDSAWVQGGGPNLPDALLKEFSQTQLQGIYEAQDFLPSVVFDDIDQHL
jgi:hypothetical protein